MGKLEVHIRAVVGHQVALDSERGLKPESGEPELEVDVLRVAHVLVGAAGVVVAMAANILVDVVEVDREPDVLGELELVREPDDRV